MKPLFLLPLLVIPFFIVFDQSAEHTPVCKGEAVSVNGASQPINLLDETNASKWRGFGAKTLPPGWTISNGMIWINDKAKRDSSYKGSLDVIFAGQGFRYFELSIDWKIGAGGNSGIYYHVQEGKGTPPSVSPEYQLIDDVNYAQLHSKELRSYNSLFKAEHPEQLQDWQKTGADYAMHAPDESKEILHPVGEWNTTKIIVARGRTEHWLNGVKLLSFEPWSKDWYARKKAGKWADSENYGIFKSGYIGLQYHGSSLWFKNITVKPLK